MDAAGYGSDGLLCRQDGPVVTVTFNRPAFRNALTYGMYDGLAAICRAVDADPSVRAMVVTGAGGRAFAAGTDIGQFRELRTAEDALAYEARIEDVLGALERCRVPIVAALPGACTGGGAAIAGCCDIRVATADLRFGFPIARTLGNALSAANLARLVGLVGAPLVKEMLFTARLLGAEEARAAGLVSAVLPDAEALARHADGIAHAMAANAPVTLRVTKDALRRLAAATATVDASDLVVEAYTSADFREGMEAFLAKRAPRWQGR